jgi:hypothetical protein
MMERMDEMHRMDATRTRRGFRGTGPWLAVIALGLALANAAVGFQNEPGIQTGAKSGIEIHVGVPLGEQPHSGFFPLHLRIQNDSASAHVWTLTFRNNDQSASYRYTTAVGVGARQRREFDLLIPWAGLDSSVATYQSISCTISGPGVVNGSFQFGSHYGGGAGMAMAAIAEPLGTSIWSGLQTKLKETQQLNDGSQNLAAWRFAGGAGRNMGRGARGSAVRLDELPPDARAFSGLAGLWLSEADWRGQPGARRDAIRQWVMQGGRLFIGGVANPKLPGLAELGSDVTPLGFGEIRKVQMPGSALPIDETARQMLDLDNAPVPPWEQDFHESWPLRKAVGEPHLNVALIIVFVCVFGVLVGPVNLLVFAPPAKRYRLFFTVPLLSAGASVLLLGLIAFGDGVGGDGARNVLMLVPAGENRLTLFQEQMVRTRLLFQRSFELPETVAASYIGSAGTEFRDHANISLAREGTRLSDDWFRTRAVQGLFLRTSIPSRGEVVLRPGPAPELLSTLSSTLRHVHYIDAAGKYWVADELSTGRPTKLRPATVQQFKTWSEEVARPFSHSLRTQFNSALGRRGYFYAEAAPTEENTLATLRGLNWKEQHVVCLGACTPQAAP